MGDYILNKTKVLQIDTDYDIEHIIAVNKKRVMTATAGAVLFSLLFILSAAAIFAHGSSLPFFILSLAVALISLFFGVKNLRKLCSRDYKNACGRVVNVSVDNVTHRLFASYGMWIRRKYDTYKTDSPRITLYIEDSPGEADGKILAFQFIASEKLLSYYDGADSALHIWGARYPVKLKVREKKWVCPLCAEFNPKDSKVCEKCGVKALK